MITLCMYTALCVNDNKNHSLLLSILYRLKLNSSQQLKSAEIGIPTIVTLSAIYDSNLHASFHRGSIKASFTNRQSCAGIPILKPIRPTNNRLNATHIQNLSKSTAHNLSKAPNATIVALPTLHFPIFYSGTFNHGNVMESTKIYSAKIPPQRKTFRVIVKTARVGTDCVLYEWGHGNIETVENVLNYQIHSGVRIRTKTNPKHCANAVKARCCM